jgi:hypothetical protein
LSRQGFAESDSFYRWLDVNDAVDQGSVLQFLNEHVFLFFEKFGGGFGFFEMFLMNRIDFDGLNGHLRDSFDFLEVNFLSFILFRLEDSILVYGSRSGHHNLH